MALLGKTFAIKPDDLNWIPGTGVEGENQLTSNVGGLTHMDKYINMRQKPSDYSKKSICSHFTGKKTKMRH